MRAKTAMLGNRGRWGVIGAAVVVVATGSFGVLRSFRPFGSKVPTAEVKLGEFVEHVQLRGELKALKSVLLMAPSGAGDLQIVKLAKNGTPVKKGEVVVQCDLTTLERQFDQKRSELKQAEAEIERSRAQARLQEEQTLTELLKARYDVERAKLDASKQEILSKIEGEKNKLKLADAEQKLREIEEKLKSDRAASAAEIESRKQKRDKALFDVRQAERAIASMTLRAPVDGMVTLLPNWRAGGFGGNAPEFREGDRSWPGAAVAELPDLSTVRVAARIDEADRGRLKPGQLSTVRVDAVPDKELTGRVAEISPLAKPDFSGWPPIKNFDVVVRLDQVDPRLRPGMSATARVAVERVPNSILIPAEAVFQKGGRAVAYVLASQGFRTRFEERMIEVARRGNGQLVVARGLRPGERVALKDPTTRHGSASLSTTGGLTASTSEQLKLEQK